MASIIICNSFGVWQSKCLWNPSKETIEIIDRVYIDGTIYSIDKDYVDGPLYNNDDDETQ